MLNTTRGSASVELNCPRSGDDESRRAQKDGGDDEAHGCKSRRVNFGPELRKIKQIDRALSAGPDIQPTSVSNDSNAGSIIDSDHGVTLEISVLTAVQLSVQSYYSMYDDEQRSDEL